jgi:hypothetical protein
MQKILLPRDNLDRDAAERMCQSGSTHHANGYRFAMQ